MVWTPGKGDFTGKILSVVQLTCLFQNWQSNSTTSTFVWYSFCEFFKNWIPHALSLNAGQNFWESLIWQTTKVLITTTTARWLTQTALLAEAARPKIRSSPVEKQLWRTMNWICFEFVCEERVCVACAWTFEKYTHFDLQTGDTCTRAIDCDFLTL